MENKIATLCNILGLLHVTKKRADKERIILNNDSEDLRYILDFLLNPRVVTGLSNSKINKKVLVDHAPVEFASIIDACEYLKKNSTGNDYTIKCIQNYIDKQPEEAHEFLRALFTKNFPIGVEAKTVNSIYGKTLIPIWEVQQAKSIDNAKLKKDEWFSLSQKLNGNRCTVYRGVPMSRQGAEWKMIDHIIKDLDNTHMLQQYVFDGELIRKNVDGLSDNENFTVGTGILNSDNADKSCIEFVVFDIIPITAFDQGLTDEEYSYKSRRINLLEFDKTLKTIGAKNVRVVPMFYEGTDQRQISKWLNYAVKHDMEGLMLNRDVPYQRKRHNGILKVKRFYTMDLLVVDIIEGEGRLEGTLGAIVVSFKGNRVNVGSGFDDAMRKKVWKNKDDYIGKLACVKYKEVSKDKKTGLQSLQFPIFERFREDKSEVSYE